jgi:hypothetical protein
MAPIRRLYNGPVTCSASPLSDSTPYYEWFWRNLVLSISFWPHSLSLEEQTNDAAIMADLLSQHNIYCSWHGRQYSQDGKCPCSGHPSGVHDCPHDSDYVKLRRLKPIDARNGGGKIKTMI